MSTTSRAPLALIFVTVFIDLLGFGIVLPLLPRYAEYYHASNLTLGLLMASFSAMQFLFAPLWGRISDRVGRRPILVLGLFGSCLFYALLGYVSPLGPDQKLLGLGVIAWLFIARIGAGIAGATIPTAQAYIADHTTHENRGKGMAIIGAAFGIGFCLGPLFGAAFVTNDAAAPPSSYPGYAAAVLSGVAALFALWKLPESKRAESASAVSQLPWTARWAQVFTNSQITAVILTIFLTTLAFAQFETTLTLLTKHQFHMANRSNFYVFAYIGFVLLIAQGWLVRKLIPKWGEFRTALLGVVLMAIGLACIATAGQMKSVPLLLLVLPVCVVGFAALSPSLQSILSRRATETEQGEVLGIGQSASALARIAGPVAGYKLFAIHPTWPHWSGAAILVVCAVLILVQKPLKSTH